MDASFTEVQSDKRDNDRKSTFVPAVLSGRPHVWLLVMLFGFASLLIVLLGGNRTFNLAGTVLQVLFLAFFIRHLAFAAAAVSTSENDLKGVTVEDGFRPRLSVLVACKNEEAVVGRLTSALLELDYPADLIEWIVIDDGSTDATGLLLDQVAERDLRFHCVHRPDGAGGGKSGALNAALKIASGEVIVVFDADHRPRHDVAWRLARHFADPMVGAVQGRCEIANGADTPLTSMVAVDYLAGYLVNEYGRQAVFGMPAYGGANCAVRTSWLKALGGWNEDSVTEDTDLTMRLMLSGGRVRYDLTAVDEEEGVVTFSRYWKQRYRWARGHQQVWRDYRSSVLHSPRLSVSEKFETMMFLYSFHMPVLSMFGIVYLFAWLGGLATPAGETWMFVYSMLLFLGPLAELSSGLLIAKADRRLASSLVWFLPLFFVSMSVSTKAWVDTVIGTDYEWVKTRRAGEDKVFADKSFSPSVQMQVSQQRDKTETAPR